jgi:hypothetical protein
MQSARDLLYKLQINAYRQLGEPLPDGEENAEAFDLEEYLRANPDNTENIIQETLLKSKRQNKENENIISKYENSSSRSILSDRINELRLALNIVDPSFSLENICFGTIPGGGLNANTYKANDNDAYAVIIPSGLFGLLNLYTRIIILLQPWEMSNNNLIYPPMSSFRQLEISSNPYVIFRLKDLLNGYFIHGEPYAALSYMKALPYQDRLVYLVIGTELYVIAHELAHIRLGHFTDDKKTAIEKEVEADKWAMTIVHHFFIANKNSFPEARASLCSLFFLLLNRMWENQIKKALSDEVYDIHLNSHPGSDERIEFYAKNLSELASTETPEWYMYVYQAMRLAVDQMTEKLLADLFKVQKKKNFLSSKVLPLSLAHLGHLRKVPEDIWWRSIADLIISDNKDERLLGLWFLKIYSPISINYFYYGVLDDDEEISNLFIKALTSIEPIYSDYLPRLKERFKETKRNETFDAYIQSVSLYLSLKIGMELGEKRENLSPTDSGFFN